MGKIPVFFIAILCVAPLFLFMTLTSNDYIRLILQESWYIIYLIFLDKYYFKKIIINKKNIQYKFKGATVKKNIALIVSMILFSACYILLIMSLVNAISPLRLVENEDKFYSFLSNVAILFFNPFYEEVVFRKIIINQLSEKHSYFYCISISAILFSILHTSDVFLMIDTLLIGFLYGYVYVKTQNILYSYLLHSVNNIVVDLSPDVAYYLGIDVVYSGIMLYIYMILTVIFFGVMVYFLNRIYKENKVFKS